MRWSYCVSAAAVLLLPMPSVVPPPVTIFTNVTVISMTTPVPSPMRTVVIRDGRIAQIDAAGRVRIPAGSHVIDGRGRYLMPGLVDAHVHLHRETDMLLYLANGVTTIRNMKGEPKHLVWRERLRDGRMFGPNLLTAGPFIEGVFSAADAEAIAREQAESGYDFLKVHGDMSLTAYRRLIAVAHSLDIPVVGHLPRNLPFDSVLAMPQSSIDHAEEYIYTFFANRVGDTARLREAADRTRAAGVAVTPTLVAYEQIGRQLDSLGVLLRQPEARFLPSIERLRWQAENNYYSRNIPATAARGFRASFRYQMALTAALQRAGVRLMLGTDAGGPETVIPGISAIRELELLVLSGLTPYQALRTATSNPAAVWHQESEFGTLVVGARADLLLLDANPLDDVRNVRRRSGVMIRGNWLPESELADGLMRAAATYRSDELAGDSLRRAGIEAMTAQIHSVPFTKLDRDRQRFFEYQLAELYRNALEQGGESALRMAFAQAHRVSAAEPPFPQGALTDLGYRYLWKKRFADAVAVLRMVASAFPDEYGAHDALGEALLIAGDSLNAKPEFQRAIDLKPGDSFAAGMLRQFEVRKP